MLAWPLFVCNVFTEQPLWGWLAIGACRRSCSFPLLVYFWGKGAYCGWICSCGALAETLGDTQRHKMPHGPLWNRAEHARPGHPRRGRAVLMLLRVRVVGWMAGHAWFGGAARTSRSFLREKLRPGLHAQLRHSGSWTSSLAGIVGVGFYFWYSRPRLVPLRLSRWPR